MVVRRNLEVKCQCGTPLARYRKGGKGRLIKLFLDRIAIDHAGIFQLEPPLQVGDHVYCPGCDKRVATVHIIRGKHAAKLNQGAIQPK